MKARQAATRAARWLGLVGLLIVVLLAWRFLPVRDWILSLDALVGRLGTWGIVLYGLLYVAAVIVLAPAEIMSIAGGLIFGLWGIPLVIVSATIGATAAFLISRYFLRAKVGEIAQRYPVFAAIDRAISEEGWKLVLLLRLNPLVPFNLQNYAFGATDIALRSYAAATFFGIMPGAAVYVYLGTLGRQAAAGTLPSALKVTSLGAGFLATVLLVFLAGRRAKMMLDNIQANSDRR
jgi:uncharacterized membrane protein YdjX (TVP38/TMEM64 family)